MKRTSFLILLFIFKVAPLLHAQNFNFSLVNDSVVIGKPGKELVVYGTITNLSASDIEIYVVRKEENLPLNWSTSLCTDICLPPNMDSTSVYIYKGQSQSFTFHFYTGTTNDSGNALASFRNANNLSEVYQQYFYGITDSTAKINEHYFNEKAILIYPNPCSLILNIDCGKSILNDAIISINNVSGKNVMNSISSEINCIDVSQLSNGYYFLDIEKNNSVYRQLFLVKH